ncbi:MAG: hypothetical protein RIQ89_1062, partial [Bacteroidota bacterium]
SIEIRGYFKNLEVGYTFNIAIQR